MPVEDINVLATALNDAQNACDMLDDADALKPLMVKLLRTITERLQPSQLQWAHGVPSRGTRPGVPNRWKYLNKLADQSPKRASRAAAYQAVDALLDMVWPIAHDSSTERSRKARADPTYRMVEVELDEQRQHEKRIKLIDLQTGYRPPDHKLATSYRPPHPPQHFEPPAPLSASLAPSLPRLAPQASGPLRDPWID